MSHNIDHIFYINLYHRPDRRAEIEQELNRFDLKYERFEAIDTPGCGSIGCSYSHLGVLKLARERGYRNVLIFEDDFQFKVSKAEFEDGLSKLFDLSNQVENNYVNESESGGDREPRGELKTKGFDVCMLGYNLIKGEVISELPWLTRVYEAQTMSGYLVHHSMYDRLIDLYEWSSPLMASTREHWNYACDQAWKRFQPGGQWYCFTQRMGVQRPSYSDNTDCFEDYGC
uniref:Glycosyltransferase n=1 Tax=viral metagenome TaxID=1070528 RepID=A0A6C0JYA1_9ZZZZ